MTTLKVTGEYFRLRTEPGANPQYQELIGRWEYPKEAIREALRRAIDNKATVVERVTQHEPYRWIVGTVSETVTGSVTISLDNWRLHDQLSREGAGRMWIIPETIEVDGVSHA